MLSSSVSLRSSSACVAAVLASAGAPCAEEAPQALEPLTVLGSREEVFRQVGSAAYLDAEEIRAANTTNVNQVLSKVPGVYVREEDGFGNFVNLSIRGADGTRSEKVTVMEDGILAAPAPYAGPAAYYTPHIARMAGLEVLKGSSQVRFGPQTTGGVVNYLSTPIPDGETYYAKTTYGNYNTFFGHGFYGNSVVTEQGRIGVLLELHGNISDGFRNIDGSRNETGFALIEPMLKVSFEPNTALKQRFEVKLGYTSFDADETYTGLTEADLRRNPDRRYAATLNDNLDSEQSRTYLKWTAEPTAALRLESALYYTATNRNWYKLDRISQGGSTRNLHNILAPGNPLPRHLGVLQGTVAGATEVKANNRSYGAYGWQNQANFSFETGELSHDLAAGLRFHYDYQERDHWLDRYAADGRGNFTYTSTTRAGQDNRKEEIFATALFVEDEIKTGKLTLRPGFRYEWLELDDRNTVNTTGVTTYREADENLFTAGIGGNYELSEAYSLYGGIYRGISSPGVANYLDGVEPEESVGYELGLRHRRDELSFELTGFYTDFQNLVSTDAGLGGDPTFNAGEAAVYGIESVIQYDAGRAAGLGYGIPLYLAATWTHAEFVGTTAGLSGGGDGIYSGGRDGNEIPYVPEWKLAAGIGFMAENWGVNLDATYTGSTWGTGYNGDPRPGTQTARDGEIDSLLTFNLGGHYDLNDQFTILAGIQNLFDERGISSRVPEGPRANSPRTLYAGIEARF
jgi:Fe(3+) dicitrate transport protein